MRKSIHSKAYAVFIRCLREARAEAGVTQTELGERLGIPQAAISKIERGERRLDIVELHEWCAALGVEFVGFAANLQSAWTVPARPRKRR